MKCMNYIFWIKVYNTIYIFWFYLNPKVIFLFIILFYLYIVPLGGVCSNLASYIWFLWKFTLLFWIRMWHCYDKIYAHNDSLCVLNYLVIFLLSHIYHLLTSKNLHVMQWFRTRYCAGVSGCRALADCATRHWAEIGIGCSYMSIFIHSDMN